MGCGAALLDGLEDSVPLMMNRVVEEEEMIVVVEYASVVPVPVRLITVGPLTEVEFVCGKGDVPEELTDVLIATVASDVDVE